MRNVKEKLISIGIWQNHPTMTIMWQLGCKTKQKTSVLDDSKLYSPIFDYTYKRVLNGMVLICAICEGKTVGGGYKTYSQPHMATKRCDQVLLHIVVVIC